MSQFWLGFSCACIGAWLTFLITKLVLDVTYLHREEMLDEHSKEMDRLREEKFASLSNLNNAIQDGQQKLLKNRKTLERYNEHLDTYALSLAAERRKLDAEREKFGDWWKGDEE